MRSLRQYLCAIQLMLIIILNTLNIIMITNEPQYYYKERFNKDFNYCSQCISRMEGHECEEFFGKLEEIFHVNNFISIIIPKFIQKYRDNKWLRLKGNFEQIIIGKYLNRETENDLQNIQIRIQMEMEMERRRINEKFIPVKPTINKWQFCPWKYVTKFAEILQNYNNLTSSGVTWFYLNIDIQLLLMPLLMDNNFPVPLTYKKCGFTLFQQSIGQNLYNFYRADFFIKLKITKQLIEGILKFSYGLYNYRIYLTDLTPDNIVYDIKRNQISLIDLNTIYIVDSTNIKMNLPRSAIHRHQYEFCSGCFAFVPSEFCQYNLSDINIFSICHLFMEDLYGRQENGFLFPIPLSIQEIYPKFVKLLQQCVHCSPTDGCQHRFHIIKQILFIVDDLLENRF